ncbi:UNVERIFIED_CONTAM: hypothetical protein NCL1_34294 [Trichonephila clavipes]
MEIQSLVWLEDPSCLYFLLCLFLQCCIERKTWVTEWHDIGFTDESSFYMQQLNGWITVGRHRGEKLFNSYLMHRCTGPVPGIMLWCNDALTHVFSQICIVNSLHNISCFGAFCPLLLLQFVFSYILIGQCATTRGMLCSSLIRLHCGFGLSVKEYRRRLS